MSLFVTYIPVDVAAVTGQLPKGAYVHGVRFNQVEHRVEVQWDHDDLETRFSFPVEVSPEDLATGRLPRGIERRARPEPGAPAKTPARASVPTPKAKPVGSARGRGKTPA